MSEQGLSEQGYRSIGAVTGLVLGLLLMRVLGYGGMIPGAAFGAAGAVLGGMSGERVAAWRRK